MDKFTIFDQILDAVFVVKSTTEIVYVNRVGSDFCALSQKRLIGKKRLDELFQFAKFSFPFNENSLGYQSPGPYIETSMASSNEKGKSGRVQMAVSPWIETLDGEPLWVFVIHDVTLEEVLHSKYRSELEQKEGYIGDLEVARAELEKYSKNLEELVNQRTQELKTANRTLQAVIDSLGQGFFTFDKSGQCGGLYTKACEDLLNTKPAGLGIDSVLKIPSEKNTEFQMWTSSLFSEPLPFEDLKPLGPDWFDASSEKSVFLEYFPIRDEGGSVSDVVVVATDKTLEVEAQRKLESEKHHVDMILKFLRGQNSFKRFLQSVPSMFERIDQISRDSVTEANPKDEMFRLLHTLEGEAGTFSLQELRLASRKPQQILQSDQGLSTQEFSQSLEDLKQTYYESVQMIEGFFGPVMSSPTEVISVTHEELEHLALICETLPGKGKDVARTIRDMKYLERIVSSFSHYDGLVQTLADKLGKQVHPIHFINGDLKADLRPLRSMISSFVHLFRNVVDHGLETPDEREFLGKSPQGKVTVEFESSNDVLKIIISDDGRGVDPSLIRRKLTEKFPSEDFSNLSDDQIVQQILRPQFSSREEVGEFSGRGVGMDAVREEVAKIGGAVRIFSQVGQGTRFEFTIPLTQMTKVEFQRSA